MQLSFGSYGSQSGTAQVVAAQVRIHGTEGRQLIAFSLVDNPD